VFRQSILYLILQLFNIIIGLFVNIYLAQKLKPEVFSVLAIYSIIIALFTTFTYMGYEQVLIRNVLNWQEQNKKFWIKLNITYAIITRLIISIIILPFVVGYAYYMDIINYGHKYFLYFLAFALSGIFFALIDSLGLILKSFNKYVKFFVISKLSNIVIRLLSIVIFINMGFNSFLVALTFLPLIVFVFAFYEVKEFIDYKLLNLRLLLKFKKYKYFIYTNYLNYLKINFDQLLVSLFVKPEILGMFNFCKRIEELGRNTIEGFFDPIIQKSVAFKSKVSDLANYINKIFKIQKIVLSLAIVTLIILYIYVDKLILLLKLSHFQYLNKNLLFVSVFLSLYIVYKIKSDLIYIFEEQVKIFQLDLLTNILNLIFTISFIYFVSQNYIYFYRIINGVVILVMFFHYYNKKFNIYNKMRVI
jgi:O-antigen/teichoic acid export membrane protein